MAAAVRACAGRRVKLTGPGGVTVEQVTYTDKLGYLRRVLRLRRHGVFIGEYLTPEELGKVVNLAELVEDDVGSES